MDGIDSCTEKRLLIVTPGNIRQSHLYVRGLDNFLPSDCIGPAKKAKSAAQHEIEIHLDGLNEIVRTDIGIASANGKPRSFFRGRRWVRRFFEHHRVAAGDRLALEKIADRIFRLSVNPAPDKDHPKAAEFFAGIGLVRLALERQGQVSSLPIESMLRKQRGVTFASNRSLACEAYRRPLGTDAGSY